jgi:hypothetical protein
MPATSITIVIKTYFCDFIIDTLLSGIKLDNPYNKKTALCYYRELHSAVKPSFIPIPESGCNYDSASAIERWLSVPRSLGVWLFRITLLISTKQQEKQ